MALLRVPISLVSRANAVLALCITLSTMTLMPFFFLHGPSLTQQQYRWPSLSPEMSGGGGSKGHSSKRSHNGNRSSRRRDKRQEEEITAGLPTHVFFDLDLSGNSNNISSGGSRQARELFADWFHFKRGHTKYDYKNQMHARPVDAMKTCWMTNPYCQTIAELPEITGAVRRLLGADDSDPLYLFSFALINVEAGHHHRLHTDLEFSAEECMFRTPGSRPGGATAWILLERDNCQDGTSSTLAGLQEQSAARELSSSPLPSPLTLFAGSHLLNFTAQDEIARVKACPKSRSIFEKCEVSGFLENVARRFVDSVPNLKVVQGPNSVGGGIVWPSSAWHMTADPHCDRKAVILQYASDLKCARKLRSVGQGQNVLPDRRSFTAVGGTGLLQLSRTGTGSTAAIEERPRSFDPLDRIQLDPKTRLVLSALSERTATKPLIPQDAAYNDCGVNKLPIIPVERARRIEPDEIFVSGKFVPNGRLPTGTTFKSEVHAGWIKSKDIALFTSMARYSSSFADRMSHLPHVEQVEELCVVLDGRLNYAMSADRDCTSTFDVVEQRRGAVTLLFAGIAHANSPDPEVDGKHICFKFFPYNNRRREDTEDESFISAMAKASIVASSGTLHADIDAVLSAPPNKRSDATLFHFQRGREEVTEITATIPGYRKLHVKIVRFAAATFVKPHIDKGYDLIVLSLDGTLEILRGEDGPAIQVPQHQFAFVPSGAKHGIRGYKNSAVAVFIEIGAE